MLKWQEILEEAQYQKLTSSYIAQEKYISLQHASVVLRRLWTWGLLRKKKDKDINCPGQPRYYYNITNKGKKYLSWYHEQQSGQKRQTEGEVFKDELDAFLTKQGIPKVEKTQGEVFKDNIDAFLTKQGIPKVKKTEEEISLDVLYFLIEEIKKGNIKIPPRGIDRYLDFLLSREYIRSCK